ncbi:Quinone-reactive Ni/Fe-hydrogenase small chain [Clarias magur]|uniref:Quinone-reactive Ni/Fe-hydrogenase small chain n=1 Tax=Clarias magur TaxID=1594786 RepID=A0A8J4TYU6_CLAMG|nr:Quinone-reactive Ni/Fe-hydrogenase small chain [Clarias magur]
MRSLEAWISGLRKSLWRISAEPLAGNTNDPVVSCPGDIDKAAAEPNHCGRSVQYILLPQ